MKPKLVRDKIPEIIKNSNKVPKTHIANDEEYWEELKTKLLEEVNEFLEDNNSEELADIQEVLYAIYDFKGFSKEEIESIRSKKENERGGFKNKIILENVE
ncbi:nucleoside triphosphate pyrophosphohydrolase [Candidatus Woesearchaeota archaeon]|nr:nucleoside triphosphate pyrophosphohydrolase [Candidatus Woesearchaeota archaeon]